MRKSPINVTETRSLCASSRLNRKAPKTATSTFHYTGIRERDDHVSITRLSKSVGPRGSCRPSGGTGSALRRLGGIKPAITSAKYYRYNPVHHVPELTAALILLYAYAGTSSGVNKLGGSHYTRQG